LYLYNKYGKRGEAFVNIIISNNRDKPIYEQIISQVKNMIMSGELNAGENLPSMRALAKSIHVSVITVQRAYEELQRDGFIETEIGRGTYVLARNKEFYKEQQQKKMEEYLQLAIEVAKENAMPLEKVTEILKILYLEDE
jgi:transcriptional regulator, gntR family